MILILPNNIQETSSKAKEAYSRSIKDTLSNQQLTFIKHVSSINQ